MVLLPPLGPEKGAVSVSPERKSTWLTGTPNASAAIKARLVLLPLMSVDPTETDKIPSSFNWQVAVAPTVDIADASATKIFNSEHIQRLGQLLEEVVGRHGDPADPATAELMRWLDVQAKRNTVLTFGGGVNEIQRELIATAGLGLPRVPR